MILGILAISLYYGHWEFIAQADRAETTNPKTGINVQGLQEISQEKTSPASTDAPTPVTPPQPDN